LSQLGSGITGRPDNTLKVVDNGGFEDGFALRKNSREKKVVVAVIGHVSS